MRRLSHRAFVGAVIALSALLDATAGEAGRVHWPTATAGDRDAPHDPIAGVRWNSEGWVLVGTAAPARMALEDLEALLAVRPDDAALHARRAVVLRVLQQFDAARTELTRALAADPHVEDDADVALTRAYLIARDGQYEEAVRAARRALPRLQGNDDARGQIVLEVARWSMARGPAGVDDAIVILRELAGPTASAAIARAMLSLALHRRGRDDEAREVARGADLPSPYASTSLRAGGLIDGETDAAVGTAYVFAGRGREAIAFLARASTRAPAAWRPSIVATLSEAQRAAPGTAANPAALVPDRLVRDESGLFRIQP